MTGNWQAIKESWLAKSSTPSEVSQWALKSIDALEDELNFSENDINAKENSYSGKEDQIKDLRKLIRVSLSSIENELDDLALNTPSSNKIQVSVPSNLSYLMKAWAAAEGRDLSSVALQCIEIGIRELKGKGGIPIAATRRYDNACEKRLALAEVNNLWEKHAQVNIEKGLIQ